jgi:hypothetical protein
MCRSSAQFMWFLHLLLTADCFGSSSIYIASQYGTCSPACMLQISLLYAYIVLLAAWCPAVLTVPGYSIQVCICLPYIDVGFTGLAFSCHPSYLLQLSDIMLYTCHHSDTQPMDYFRLATGRRKSSLPRGALADISCCLL